MGAVVADEGKTWGGEVLDEREKRKGGGMGTWGGVGGRLGLGLVADKSEERGWFGSWALDNVFGGP